MMADQSNEADPSIIREAAEEIVAAAQDDNTVDESAEEEEVEGLTADGATSTKKKRRKKSKKNKVDQSPDKLNSDTSSERPGERRLEMVDQLLAANPALKAEMAGMPKETAVESLKKMDVSKLLSNLVRTSHPGSSSQAHPLAGNQRQEQERHVSLQVLADATRSPLWYQHPSSGTARSDRC